MKMNNQNKTGIFISHITDEKGVAQTFQTYIRKIFGDNIPIFVSSDYKSIGGGKEWFGEIITAIKNAKVVIVLLSKESVDKRWINFEAGIGLGAECRVIPVTIGNIDKGDIGPPLSQLQVRDLKDNSDALGVFHDIGEELTKEVNDINIEAFVKEIETKINSLPVKGVLLEPTIKQDDGNFFRLNFTLRHTGNRDIKLIKLWAALPRYLLAGWVTSGYNPPVLMVNDNEMIDGKAHVVKEYRCTDVPILPAYDQSCRPLPTVFQQNMSPYSLPQFFFPIKGQLSDAERDEYLQCQVFAEGLNTQMQKVQLKDILP